MAKIRVNGTDYDGSIILKIAGEEFSGPNEVSYDDKRERGKTWGFTGRNRKPVGRTRGKYTPSDATLKGPKKGMIEIRNKLAALGANCIGDPEFTVTVSYLDAGFLSVTDVLEGATLAGIKGGASADSSDAATEEWTLDLMGIKWSGGQTLYNQI